MSSDDSGWTPEEIDEAMRTVPMTGRQIVEAGLLGGWESEQIKDAAEWVAEQRNRRRARISSKRK
jgi:hypothetical protein